MKKLMFGLAIAAVGTAFAVESSNIVGYTTRNAPQNSYRLAGIQFKTTANTAVLQDIVSMSTEVENEDDEAFWVEAPSIQIQKAGSVAYDSYWYIKNAVYTTDDWETTDVKPGWADDFGVLCIPEYYDEDPEQTICQYSGLVTPGIGAWFCDPEKAGSLLASGQVPNGEYSVTCPTGYRLRAGAYPTATKINDASQVAFTGITPVENEDDEAFWTTAPSLQVQKADGSVAYDSYYYISNAVYTTDDWETTDVKVGWADDFGVLCVPEYYDEDPEQTICLYSGLIPAGNGMWSFGGPSAFTMTFKGL